VLVGNEALEPRLAEGPGHRIQEMSLCRRKKRSRDVNPESGTSVYHGEESRRKSPKRELLSEPIRSREDAKVEDEVCATQRG
jgi:hypothetical protein